MNSIFPLTQYIRSYLRYNSYHYKRYVNIAVKVIAYRIAVERDQAVVRIIPEAAVGGRGYVDCCIIAEDFGRNYGIITGLLDSPLSYSAEIIIRVAHFGRICKHEEKTTAQN